MDDFMLHILQLARRGYTCSQILLLLGLESRGGSNPGLVRAMAGLAYGCGSGRATCGALTGACCLLAFGTSADDQISHAAESLPVMLQELEEWFVGTAGGLTCEAITGEGGPSAARQRCGRLVADTFVKVTALLAENGFA